MKICPECNSINENNERFCRTCGASLADVHISQECVTCSVCQTVNDVDNDYCTGCNNQLNKEEGVSLDEKKPDTYRRLKKIAVVFGIMATAVLSACFIIYKIKVPGVPPESVLPLNNEDASLSDSLMNSIEDELEGYSTVRVWFASVSEEIQKYELSDAEAMKLNDLTHRVSSLDETKYEDQLAFIRSTKELRDEVTTTRPLTELTAITSSKDTMEDSEATESLITHDYKLDAEWDLSQYPEIYIYVHVKDINNGQEIKSSNLKSDFSWVTGVGTHWEYEDFKTDFTNSSYYFKLTSDKMESSDELLEEWQMDIRAEVHGQQIETTVSCVPAYELAEDLLGAYLNAYIYDVNNHSLDRIMQYIETDVPEDDNFNWTIFYQMRKEINNGFLDTKSMDLKDFQVNFVERSDEQTLHIYSTERYDGTYEEPFSVWKNEGNGIADNIRQLIGEVADQQEIRLSAYVTQKPEYLLRKSADGSWKFYSYTGDLSLIPNWSVYEAREVY